MCTVHIYVHSSGSTVLDSLQLSEELGAWGRPASRQQCVATVQTRCDTECVYETSSCFGVKAFSDGVWKADLQMGVTYCAMLRVASSTTPTSKITITIGI